MTTINQIQLLNISFDFSVLDSDAWGIALSGYLIVFVALVLLFLVFLNLPKLLNFLFRKKAEPVAKSIAEEITEEKKNLSGEVNAAIAMTLYLYFNEMHDEESNVMTIKRISRMYSPWSSKIYTVRNQFNRQ